MPAALTPDQAKHVLGAQAQLWSEYIVDAKHLQYITYPRACALCEVLWSPGKDRDLDASLTRLKQHLQPLDAAAVNYRPLGGN